MRRRLTAAAAVVALAAFALGVAGCGLNVASADLFVLTRSGQPGRLTLLVNDGGTISCDGGPRRPISDALLIAARDLSDNLDKDAQAGLRIPAAAGSVAYYTIRLQSGTVAFPDTAASRRHELAAAELFALQAQEGPCRGALRR